MLDDIVEKCHATALIGCGLVHVGRHSRSGSFFSSYWMWTSIWGTWLASVPKQLLLNVDSVMLECMVYKCYATALVECGLVHV